MTLVLTIFTGNTIQQWPSDVPGWLSYYWQRPVLEIQSVNLYIYSFARIFKLTLFTAKADPVYTLQTLDSGYFNQGKSSLHKDIHLEYHSVCPLVRIGGREPNHYITRNLLPKEHIRLQSIQRHSFSIFFTQFNLLQLLHDDRHFSVTLLTKSSIAFRPPVPHMKTENTAVCCYNNTVFTNEFSAMWVIYIII